MSTSPTSRVLAGVFAAHDAGWTDSATSTQAEAGHRPFCPYRGKYAFHCHNLEDEDMAMMANSRWFEMGAEINAQPALLAGDRPCLRSNSAALRDHWKGCSVATDGV